MKYPPKSPLVRAGLKFSKGGARHEEKKNTRQEFRLLTLRSKQDKA